MAGAILIGVRIVFTAIGLPGHFYPLVPLAWACRAAGHDVLMVTTDGFVPSAVRSGLPVASCGQAADFVDLVTHGGVRDEEYANGRAFGRIARQRLPRTERLLENWRPDLVVSERAEFAGPIAAHGLGIPQVELHWGRAALAQYRIAAADELRPALAAGGLTGLPRPHALLNPWPPGLRLPYATGHRSVRHESYNGDALVPGWVLEPRTRPRVCMTLGTVVPRIGEDAVTMWHPVLVALARLDVELVVAVADAVAARWPALPDAVRHLGWLPLSQSLGACDVIIHHGGQGTTLTALATGRPQVMLPVFDDQFDNTEAVVGAGAGLRLLPDEVTPEAVATYTAEVLGGAEYGAAAAGVAAEIAAQPSTADTVRVLTDLVRDPLRRAA
jgi:UDP:flavonoid glycosyltransferase YjiC (YdhE family)